MPISTMPLLSTTTINTPTSVCSTLPCPPESAVPPTTTAVTVANRGPWPISELPSPSWGRGRPRGTPPPQSVEGAGDGEGGDAHPVDRDAGECGHLLAPAQRVHV